MKVRILSRSHYAGGAINRIPPFFMPYNTFGTPAFSTQSLSQVYSISFSKDNIFIFIYNKKSTIKCKIKFSAGDYSL